MVRKIIVLSAAVAGQDDDVDTSVTNVTINSPEDGDADSVYSAWKIMSARPNNAVETEIYTYLKNLKYADALEIITNATSDTDIYNYIHDLTDTRLRDNILQRIPHQSW